LGFVPQFWARAKSRKRYAAVSTIKKMLDGWTLILIFFMNETFFHIEKNIFNPIILNILISFAFFWHRQENILWCHHLWHTNDVPTSFCFQQISFRFYLAMVLVCFCNYYSCQTLNYGCY
jgi:hypothetical protein